MELQLQPSWHFALLILAALALGVFALWSYPPGTPRRRWLIGLRWLAIALAIFAMFQPRLVFSKKEKNSSVLVLLADKSKSMLLKDMWNDLSRWDALVKVLGDAEPALAGLSETVQVRRFAFGKKLTEDIAVNQAPVDDQTAIGDALDQLVDRLGDERIAGAVLLSDGANTAGRSPISAVQQRRGQEFPIFAFGFGQEVANDQVKDIAGLNMVASPTVFAKNKMTVRGEYQAQGFAHKPVAVRLLFDGVEQKRGMMEIGKDGQRIGVDLVGVPATPGDLKVTVEAETQAGELLASNNAVSTYVTVLAGGITVLQIEGKYRFWEPKYIRWALDQSPDIDLSQVFLLDNQGRRRELPTEMFTPGKFDVMLLGDVAASQFTPDQLEAIAKLVEKGTGLIMTAGYEAFGPGGWGDSPLARVLPINVRPADGQTAGEIPFVPTNAGFGHFILRLAADNRENFQLWRTLRPLDGMSLWSGLKPNALILATAPNGAPLMAVQEFGAGRSMALAVDTTWRWRRNEEGKKAHARFWRQAILWLAKKDEGGDAQIRLVLERRRVAAGQTVPIEVRIENPDGSPVKAATASAAVTAPDGKEYPVTLIREGTAFRGGFAATDAVGDYVVKATGNDAGKSLGTRSARFLTFHEDSEMRQIAADHALLQALAKTSGGEFHPPEELPKFLESLKQRDLNVEVSRPVRENLWNRWELLLLFIAVLGLEWVIRKRHGLI